VIHDKDYWAIVPTSQAKYYYAIVIGRTRTEAIKEMVGGEGDYQKRWKRVKRWKTRPRIVRATVSWEEPSCEK
jgi:hypothetical protein